MVKSIRLDKLTTALTQKSTYDTTLTFFEFDERLNRIRSVSISHGDTVSVSRSEYDASNRITSDITYDDDFRKSISKYEYDKNGNLISEIMLFDGIELRTDVQFDKLNRPIRRESFRQETSSKLD